MRWVSERELRRPRWRSWFRRMAKAIKRGMAMVKKVQQIQEVLWIASQRDWGKRYIGIGTTMEIIAMTETVKGKPRLCGHLGSVSGVDRVREGTGQTSLDCKC